MLAFRSLYKLNQMLTRDEMMLNNAKSELSSNAENFLEKLATFEIRYPKIWANISESLYAQTDMNLGDLINTLQIFSEITN